MRGVVRVPGSKSETNRALILAALADGSSTLQGVLTSRDSDLMCQALQEFGVQIERSGDTAVVRPPARLQAPGRPIDCGLAGTVMRFVPPIAALLDATTQFTGDEQAFRRPMAPILRALRDVGADVSADALPFSITGPVHGGTVTVDASESSQFISGLLLAAPLMPGGLTVRHDGATLPSRPHIEMTCRMLRERGVDVTNVGDEWRVSPGPIRALDATIEPDLTTAAVFLAAAAATNGEVTVPGWSNQSAQPGRRFADVLREFGADVDETRDAITVRGHELNGIEVDLSSAAELTPVVATLAALAHGTTTITGVGYIRGHETDRLAALESEVGALGADIRQTDDGLVIEGRGAEALHPAALSAHADHRMAHVAALAGLVVAGVTLDDVECTSKTMPTFPAVWAELVGTDA